MGGADKGGIIVRSGPGLSDELVKDRAAFPGDAFCPCGICG